MKLILEFDDVDAYDKAIQGSHWASVVMEVDEHLRSRLKYEELSKDVYEALDRTREKLHAIVNDEGLAVYGETHGAPKRRRGGVMGWPRRVAGALAKCFT